MTTASDQPAMIQCDCCSVWYHGVFIGVSEVIHEKAEVIQYGMQVRLSEEESEPHGSSSHAGECNTDGGSDVAEADM